MKLRYVALALYIAQWPITYGGTLAYFQREFPDLAAQECRRDVGFAIFIATVPIDVVMAPLLSGFYQDGVEFTCTWKRGYR